MKINLKEIGFWLNYVGWINLAYNRDQWEILVNMVMNLQVP
jgi:hypothetical protein